MEDVLDKADILTGRFFLAIKDQKTSIEVLKARFVVQGHEDPINKSLVHSLSVSRQNTTKVVVEIATIFRLELFSIDVTQINL